MRNVTFSGKGGTLKDADDGELIVVGHSGPGELCILSADVVYPETAAKTPSKSGLDFTS
jgi:hypothetical protein